MVWEKIARLVNRGVTTIVYAAMGTDLRIESRKQAIPHAGSRPGTWDHTSYFVMRNGKQLAEKQTLKDAKKYAEALMGE